MLDSNGQPIKKHMPKTSFWVEVPVSTNPDIAEARQRFREQQRTALNGAQAESSGTRSRTATREPASREGSFASSSKVLQIAARLLKSPAVRDRTLDGRVEDGDPRAESASGGDGEDASREQEMYGVEETLEAALPSLPAPPAEPIADVPMVLDLTMDPQSGRGNSAKDGKDGEEETFVRAISVASHSSSAPERTQSSQDIAISPSAFFSSNNGRTLPRQATYLPDVVTLAQDDEIKRILGRRLINAEDYMYTVKLTDGRKVQVDEETMQAYTDLVETYLEQVEEGYAQDGIIDEDTSSGEEDMTMARSRKGKGKMRIQDENDETYGQNGDASSEKEGGSSGEEMTQDDATTDEDDMEIMGGRGRRTRGKKQSKTGRMRAPSEPTRASSRQKTTERPNYALVEEDDAMDEDEASERSRSESGTPARSDSEESVVRVKPSTSRNGSFRVTSVQAKRSRDTSFRTSSGDSEVDELATDEEEVDLKRLHKPECAHCDGSSSKVLAEMLKQRKGKKRKSRTDDDFDEDMLNKMASWIECETCCNAWHFGCLPEVTHRRPLKHRIVAKHATGDKPKPYLDVNASFTTSECPDCSKAKGTRCFICKKVHTVETKHKGDTVVNGETTISLNQINESLAKKSVENADDAAMEAPTAQEEPTAGGTGQTAADLQASGEDVPALLFRCDSCRRPAHYGCIGSDDEIERWQEQENWVCSDCRTWGAPDAVLAWRSLDEKVNEAEGDSRLPLSQGNGSARKPSSPGKPTPPASLPSHKDITCEAEYLVKFQEESFRHAQWVPHAWLFAKYRQRLRNFLVKGPLIDIQPERTGEADEQEDHLDNFSLSPLPDAMDRIPKEWLTPDRILETKYKPRGGWADVDSVNMKNLTTVPEESISRIAKIYVKWQGLPYESATWETWPSSKDPVYARFMHCYRVFLLGLKVSIPRLTQAQLNALDKPRPESQFVAPAEQPDFIKNGKLMDFQLEGVTWLYFNWWKKKGCILADEMGLGKTVQIISFISILYKVEMCQPFLIVVPQSTLSNWQREFEKWAPEDLRVVPYYGSKASKAVQEKYELYTAGSYTEQKLRAHVVLTTYESIDRHPTFFKRAQRWEALVVDEGQRLKAGKKGLLWKALREQRIGHHVLLTGTPVNNNLDELFHLLHFIDPGSFPDLDALHTKFEVLTPELVAELQALAQPYFLRRTKEGVLDLPPTSEVTVPLSMSPLQKVVYKSVLENNYEALAAIFDAAKTKGKKAQSVTKLKNTLMQLRKTLCHPYLVKEELEHESRLDAAGLHKSLVEASSKLVFLSEMIPKLRARGHRILLFSQFVIVLNIIERFLEGEKIKHVRLDGSTPQSVRQENIDAFNAPNSDIPIFILSTRAGGVGINLATADTVIIFDADFNPFQDLQAISRAHRIGQTKKVLVFKLLIKGTCEEKILEKGKKKLVLEQLIIDNNEDKSDDEEDAPNNVESLLLFGAKALFEESPEDAAKSDIKYSSADIDDIIERTEKEEESSDVREEKKRKIQESNKAFSYARIWEGRKELEQEEEQDKGEVEAQRGFWTTMIQEQEIKRANEIAIEEAQRGRGFRWKKKLSYAIEGGDEANTAGKRRKSSKGDASDGEFNAVDYSDESGSDFGGDGGMNGPSKAEFREMGDELKRARLGLPPGAPLPSTLPLQPNGQPATSNGAMPRVPLQPIPKPPQKPVLPPQPKYPVPGQVYFNPTASEESMRRMERSPTPEDMTTKRQLMVRNLNELVKQVSNPSAVALLNMAQTAKRGEDQLNYIAQATKSLQATLHPPAPPKTNAVAATVPKANGTAAPVPIAPRPMPAPAPASMSVPTPAPTAPPTSQNPAAPNMQINGSAPPVSRPAA